MFIFLGKQKFPIFISEIICFLTLHLYKSDTFYMQSIIFKLLIGYLAYHLCYYLPIHLNILTFILLIY